MARFVNFTAGLPILLCCFWPALHAQRNTGELRLQVVDATGAGIAASGELSSQATQVHLRFATRPDGQHVIPALPFGVYRLSLEHSGFKPASELIEIRSEVPLPHRVTLGVAPIETTVEATDTDTLLNPDRTGALQHLGSDTIRDRRSAPPGRAVISLVDTQPGWLLEANGVLHPRGSEYGVQYVVDGLPLFENRSPAFAPTLDIEEFQSLNVRTGGYPAEYGHQLGGVIEVTTTRDSRPGLHGKASAEGGSFATASGSATLQYVEGRNTLGISADAMRTDRYLDPPVLLNYSNHASGTGVAARFDRDWSDSDRTRFLVRHNRTGFLVPNELLQELAGQRQDRSSEETSGQVSHTHLFSPHVLMDLRASGRDDSAALWSNSLSTPIAPSQLRGFREAYGAASVSAQFGRHELKAGTEALFRSIDEEFAFHIKNYRLNGVSIFDSDTPRNFRFADRRQNREQAAYAQDTMRFGSLTVSAGLRWDHYRLLLDESAVSPRLAAAWGVSSAGLVLRASYDRAFQTPPIENILLGSTPATLVLNDQALRLPVHPSRGNFYEAGFSKTLGSHARLDGTWFRRNVRNFADDDVLLNTGVSFPIAFARAAIYGLEAKLDMPRLGPISGFVSYSNMLGFGSLPVAGGLFLQDGAAALLSGTGQFAITQDQRNTARARLRGQVLPRLWVAGAAQYGSGLPVQLDVGTDIALLAREYGQRVLDRVNPDRGRVRPSFSLDLSVGADVWKHEQRAVRAQVDVFNLTNRLNVINFAGLFSGTALAPQRWAAMRVQFEF